MSRWSLPGDRSIDLTRTRVMGILNATPDSFHAGSRAADADDALRRAERMISAGVDVLDVGGESSRPGAAPVGADEETARVVPVVEAVRRRFDVAISVDTTKASVARRALEAGADACNDVTALSDADMAGVVARSGAGVVLMHMRGTPRTMQRDTGYDDLVGEIGEHLERSRRKAVEAGIADDKIVLDPGIGFGKDVAGNLEIVRRIPDLIRLGRPLLIGASRKGFIGQVLDRPVERRLEGSLAVAALAAWLGARLIRVHDVGETVDVVRMIDAVRGT